jgi:hypothetical protein
VSDKWSFPNRRLPNGTWECATKDAAILFRPDGTMYLRRGSKSLIADWKSVAGRRGAVDESRKRGAPMPPEVFDLLHLDSDPNPVFAALREILVEGSRDKARRKIDEFARRLMAVWAIKHPESGYQSFNRALKKLAEQLRRPPTKRGTRCGIGRKRSAYVEVL